MVRILLFFLPSLLLAESPWGKDSDLVQKETAFQKSYSAPFQQAILFHQNVLSSADGPRSHFYPTSSRYSYEAISKLGVPKGLLLTFDRLMRENDERWVYQAFILNEQVIRKYDPVPEPKCPKDISRHK